MTIRLSNITPTQKGEINEFDQTGVKFKRKDNNKIEFIIRKV